MANSATYNRTKIHFAEGAAAATPDAAEVVTYAKADGLMYSKDDAGVETLMSGGAGGGAPDAHAASHENGGADEIDVTGLTGAGGGSDVGLAVIVAPPLISLTNSTTNNADMAFAIPINVPSAMLLRALTIRASAGTAGVVQWGLFDYTATPTAATKLAGASSALATGFNEVAAAGAPVSVVAGNYMIVVHLPSATQPTLYTQSLPTACSAVRFIDPYTWDDTPDFTTGWADTSQLPMVFLFGDLKSGTQW
jgi:hypothetical protein